jgi:hypothetical protein
MYDFATYDAGRAAPGTVALWNGLQQHWPQARFLGIYNARSIRGSDRLSLHAEGRALDFVPPSGSRDLIAGWLREHAVPLGIQEVIVYETKRIWTTARASEGWRPYAGTSSGMKHIHVGQHRQGAGIAGGAFDARVLAETIRNLADGQGLRWYHAVIYGLIAAGITTLELHHQRTQS